GCGCGCAFIQFTSTYTCQPGSHQGLFVLYFLFSKGPNESISIHHKKIESNICCRSAIKTCTWSQRRLPVCHFLTFSRTYHRINEKIVECSYGSPAHPLRSPT
ncbi:unnamed protein product, partial [Ectocarpus sp. 12 AP-2014]